MKLELNMGLEQRQILTQTQIQSLEILSMDNFELSGYLQNEYLENPVLDHIVSNETAASLEDYNQRQEVYPTHYQGEYQSIETVQEKQNRLEIPAPNHGAIEIHIKEQLNRKKFSEHQWKIIDFLIHSLDHNGFLTITNQETASIMNCLVSDVEVCLNELKRIEPCGIFSKDLSECLMRQLTMLEVKNPILHQIVKDYLTQVAEGRLSQISRALNISTAEVRKYIAIIEKLNPRPLAGFQTDAAEYIIPDIICIKKEGQWEIRLNETWMGDYHLNDYYLKMMNQVSDKELYLYFKKKLERANFIIQSLNQRRQTILQISETVLDWQKEYLEDGGYKKPMTMTDVAEKLQIHPSTVSRAVKGKYIQLPSKTILFKNLFEGAIRGEQDKNAVTAVEIKKYIKSLIGSENKNKPYSDQKISDLLKTQGITISRRAAAKYREALGIKGSYDRKYV